MKTKEGICGLCFHSPGCGVIAHFDENDRLVRLSPDPEAPFGQRLCPLADAVEEIVYSEKRLRTPLKRKGPKGTYDFVPISWDEAYGIIADKLFALKEKYGPEVVGFYAGTGSYERALKDTFRLKDSEIYLAASILFPFGSPNTFGVGAPCYTSLGVLAPKLTLGCLHTDMYSDVDNSDLILVWGTDPATATPPTLFERLKTAAAEGAEIIVIDPRKTKSAELPGSRWIPIRPGSDGALALGLSHILIRDNRYDKGFVENWTLGFPEFADYVREFPPSLVSTLTGIAESTIEELAKKIVDAEGASYVMYTGLEYSKCGVQSIRAVMVLWALAGQLDVEGGRCFLGNGNAFPLPERHLLATPGWKHSIGKDRFPVYAHYCGGEPHASLLPDAILEETPYSIKALLVLGASLQTCWPNPFRWRQALEKLDFLVTMDRQLTADAAYADIVLPATTAFEQESYCYYGSTIRYRDRLIPPVGEAKPSFQILTELAEKLGYGNLFPKHPDEVLSDILALSGYTLEDLMAADRKTLSLPKPHRVYRKWEKGLLRPDGKPGFPTPSGKLEIASTVLAEHGYPPLPVYEESDETPVSAPERHQQFPLILGTGPFKPDMKSCLRAIPAFIKRYPYPVVELNPSDADTRDIACGDQVVVKTARGEIPMRTRVTNSIMQGTAYAPVGGGGPQGTEEWQAANVNELTDPAQYDPISGFPVYKTLLCEITKKKRMRKGSAAVQPAQGCSG